MSFLQREIGRLHEKLLRLCGLVERNLAMAASAVETRDADLARSVVDADAEVDRLEVELEETGLKVLALHQPVAADLRLIVGTLKIVNDLERIGDLAVNIARQTLRTLQACATAPAIYDFAPLTELVTRMLRMAIDSLVEYDAEMAEQVLVLERDVDGMFAEMASEAENRLERGEGLSRALLAYFSVARNLERIGDHSTNIAEDVIYMIRGTVIRHQGQRSAQGDTAYGPRPGEMEKT